MLLFIQILMSSIQASIEACISSHLSHAFKVIYACIWVSLTEQNYLMLCRLIILPTGLIYILIYISLVLKRIPVVNKNEGMSSEGMSGDVLSVIEIH